MSIQIGTQRPRIKGLPKRQQFESRPAWPLVELQAVSRPVKLDSHQALQGEVRAAWNERGEAWVGTGALVTIQASGRERFTDLKKQATAVFASLTHRSEGAPPEVKPRFIVGAAFHRDHEPRGLWSGFDALRAWLPARQIQWVDGKAYETVITTEDAITPVDSFFDDAPLTPNEPRTTWTARASRVLRSMERLNLDKVVLSRWQKMDPTDPVDLLHKLAGLEPGTVRFMLEPQQGAALVGATPERLVVQQGGITSTHALAGSAPRSNDPDEDRALALALAKGEKERREHRTVAEHLMARLRMLRFENVKVSKPRIKQLRTVQHLETQMQADSGDLHVLDVVQSFHPTPAVAGTPPEQAQNFLRRLEPFERGWYSGPVGWFDADGDGKFVVALRCALCREDGTWLFAGAGLVRGSDPLLEYEETEAKLRALRELL